MDDTAKELVRTCSGWEAVSGPFREAWLICGRRAGKSFILALVAVFLSVFRDWSPHLAPGEMGTVMVIARDRKQARVIFRYIRALLTRVPVLQQMIVRETAEEIELDNGPFSAPTTAA
jgi:hypothetical protein